MLNLHRQCSIEFRSFGFQVEATTGNAQQFGQLAFIEGLPRSTQRAGQFHSMLFAHESRSPRDFFSRAFWTVNSPISFFNSSGDSPAAYPSAFARVFGLRLSVKTPGPSCWNSCRHRLTTELGTSNLRHTSSMVVSRCKLSTTTLNLNSAVYDFRLPGIFDVPFSCFTVYFTRYGTEAVRPRFRHTVIDTRTIYVSTQHGSRLR